MPKSNASEVRITKTTYVQPERLDYRGDPPARPLMLWFWFGTYVTLTVIAIILVSLWISSMGGLAWGNTAEPNRMFNYHPLFIILAFVLITGHTSLLYRIFPEANITLLRLTHATLQLTSWTLVVVAVYAVGASKDYVAMTRPGYARHFVSVHSWVGLTILIVMTLQFFCGFFGLLVPGCTGERRVQYRDTHIFTGNFIFLLACANILIGIDQLRPTTVMNTLALFIVFFAMVGAYLLATKKWKIGRSEHPDERANPDERARLIHEGPGQRYD